MRRDNIHVGRHRALRGIGLLLLGAALLPRIAAAGDRPLEVLLVNMTPDAASDEASRRCVREIDKVISAADTHVSRMGETALRKLAGKTAGEPFLSWPAESLRPTHKRAALDIDTVVLVDCRPGLRRLDVLVQPSADGLARIQTWGMPLDEATVRLTAESILRRAWAGYSP